jgi:hypothetical protein
MLVCAGLSCFSDTRGCSAVAASSSTSIRLKGASTAVAGWIRVPRSMPVPTARGRVARAIPTARTATHATAASGARPTDASPGPLSFAATSSHARATRAVPRPGASSCRTTGCARRLPAVAATSTTGANMRTARWAPRARPIRARPRSAPPTGPACGRRRAGPGRRAAPAVARRSAAATATRARTILATTLWAARTCPTVRCRAVTATPARPAIIARLPAAPPRARGRVMRRTEVAAHRRAIRRSDA